LLLGIFFVIWFSFPLLKTSYKKNVYVTFLYFVFVPLLEN